MNAQVTMLVPAAVYDTTASEAQIDSLEKRHENMIINGAALAEALLEDPTDEVLNQVEDLIKQIGTDLAYCRQALQDGGSTAT